MIIIPAIDLLENQAVRLFKGNYADKTVYSKEPWQLAQRFEGAGAEIIHLVDLNAAKGDAGKNADAIQKIRETTGCKIQIGGGIRNKEVLSLYDKMGMDRFILGTAAVKDPDFLHDCYQDFGPERIAVAVDARDGFVKVSGWEKDSGLHYRELMDRLAKLGIRFVIFTDIAQDGTLAGPNLSAYEEILKDYDFDLIASGGISSLKDIMRLSELGDSKKVYGVITGKAIYEGKLDLQEAISSVGEEDSDIY